jgi:hypothetical protein
MRYGSSFLFIAIDILKGRLIIYKIPFSGTQVPGMGLNVPSLALDARLSAGMTN